MKKYNCTICGAGCYSADTTKTICAECEKDGNLVEVVRCKDCKDHDSWSHTCVHWTHHCTPPGYSYKVNEDDYCAWGERREK